MSIQYLGSSLQNRNEIEHIIFSIPNMPAWLLLVLLSTAATQCTKGGLLTTQGACLYPDYIEGCLTYALDLSCSQCEYNYQLQSGLCLYKPNPSPNCCTTFGNSSACLQCAAGLQPNPVSSLCEDNKLVGCLQKGKAGCQLCAWDFDLVGNTCTKAVTNCSEYDSKGHCLKCNNNNSLVAGACLWQRITEKVDNCKIITEFGCGLCSEGYRVDAQGACQRGIIGCSSHSLNGACLRCLSPFYELTNNACTVVGCLSSSNGLCTLCDSSYGFSLVAGRCEIENCLYFSRRGCSVCSGNLVAGPWGCRKPTGAVCLVCKSDEYLTSDQQCRKRDLHCTGYLRGVCQGCCEQYFLDPRGSCLPTTPGCIYQAGVCSSCASPFTFANHTCTIEGCRQYSKDGCLACDPRLQLLNRVCGLSNCQTVRNFQCLQCFSGYQPSQNGSCILSDPYCSIRNSQNLCLQCKDGYMLGKDSRCTSVKVGCNYVDGVCVSCRAPFTYLPASQSCAIDGCVSYFLGGCKQCVSGYSLLYNSCKWPNCLISLNGSCLECDPDYLPRSDGSCVSKDEYCDKMDENGTCLKCMGGYYYSTELKRCVKKEPGCLYDPQGHCNDCYKPFQLAAGRCSIRGCLDYQIEGCSLCQYPFVLLNNRTCAIAHCSGYQTDGHCSQCEDGFMLSSNFLCEIQDQFCKTFDANRTACLSCVKGYRLDSRGRCEYTDSHCASFDSSGLCMNCDRLYFLNSLGSCQLRDAQCLTYTNGLCSECRAFFFVQHGLCMPNMAGCKVQRSYQDCLSCDEGYQLSKGSCMASVTRLNWNSIDMDFGEDTGCSASPPSPSTGVFTAGVQSTDNLLAALTTGKGSVFFSSSTLANASVLLNSQNANGWSPKGGAGEYVGFKSTNTEIYYACDVKQLPGSSLSAFALEYSLDGISFTHLGEFHFATLTPGTVTTFYFKAVQAQLIRLVAKTGTPHIKLEFYYGAPSTHTNHDPTFIGTAVAATVDGAETGGISICKADGLCWAGTESCEPKRVSGFTLLYDENCTDRVSEVAVEYSTDGLTFQCWNGCKPTALNGNSLQFSGGLLAEKLHVHFTKYGGQPRFGIKFNYS